MKFFYGKEIQDGDPRLKQNNAGRITIYRECISLTRGPSVDHNDLLRIMIAEWGLQKERDAVISGASRYYYLMENGTTIISPVRRIDDNDFYDRREQYTRLIVSVLA
jgi:hypothetical protein